MSKYIVSYDLVEEEGSEGYNKIIREIIRLGGERVLFSQWLVSYDGEAQSLFNLLWPHMDNNDRLLVNGIGNSYWWGVNLMADPKR